MSLPAASSWSGARYAGVLLVATVLILVAIAGGCSLADTCPNYSPLSTRSLPLSVQSAVELSAVDQSNMKLRLNDTQIQRNDTVVPEIRQIVRVGNNVAADSVAADSAAVGSFCDSESPN